MAYTAYSKQTWEPGSPITQQKMNHIEDGIEKMNDLNSTVVATQTTANNASSTATANSAQISNLNTRVGSLETGFEQNASNGQQAMAQIHAATDTWSGEPTYENLASHFMAIEQYASSTRAIANANATTLDEAKRTSADTLVNRFRDVETAQTALNGAMNSLSETLVNAGGTNPDGSQRTLSARLNSIDGGTTPSRTLPNVITELTEAHGTNGKYLNLNARFEDIEGDISDALASSNKSKTFGSLDARFEELEQEVVNARGGLTDIDTRLDNIESNASNLSDNKISTSAIANNLTTNTAGLVLDARQGKELKDTIDSMDTAYKAADTALDGRLDAIDGGSVLDTTNGTLSARVGALETTIDTAQTGLIARVTTVESDLNTATTGLKAKMAQAESDIDVLEEDQIGIKSRLSTLDDSSTGVIKTLQDADTGLSGQISALDARLDAIDNGTALDTTNGTLGARVTVLEGSGTVVINKPVSGSNYTEGLPNSTAVAAPSANIDYLIQDDNDKYFYWRYINSSWELISGAGGGGTGSSSGEFAASLSSTDIPNPDVNTDYFVGDNTVGFTHYRYVIPSGSNEGSFVRILPKGLLANASVNSNGKPVITTIDDSNTNILNSFNALKSVDCVTEYEAGTQTPKYYTLSFTDINGQEYAWNLAAGGGGSSYSVQFINETGSNELYIPNSASAANLTVRLQALMGQTTLSQTATITVKYKLASEVNYSIDRVINNVVNNTSTDIDIIDLLAQDSVTNIQLTASITPEDTPIERNITFIVHRVPMSIVANNYNPAAIKTGNFNFQYYCIGANLAKIVHFVVDGTDTTVNVGTPANTDLLTQQISTSGLTRGMHTLKVYFTVGSFTSNEINTYFLYETNTSNEMPIIALATEKTTIYGGDELNVNYTVYRKGLEKTDKVTLTTYTTDNGTNTYYDNIEYLEINNNIVNTIPIRKYPASGTFYISMTAAHTVDNIELTNTQTISVTIIEQESAYDNQMTRAGAENLIYEYVAYGRTNNDSDKAAYEYTYTSVSGTSTIFTGTNNGFNWASNGYTNGNSLLISGGATHTIDLPLFLASTNNISLEPLDETNEDILVNGRTFEIDYEVNSATNLNAEIASFGNGLKITPSVSYLVPQNTTVTVNSHGLIEKEDEICAAYLTTGKRMHMVFVIEPKSTIPTSQNEYHQCVNIYINGEFVNSCPYVLSDNFSTSDTFTIGSNTCIIKLYSIRMYNRGLTNDEVLRNYMMEPNTKSGRISRFANNDVLDNNKLVSYEKAINKFNCLLITGEISPYKKDTKTPSGVTLTKPNPSTLGYTTEFNLLDKKSNDTYYSSNNVQGTSSQTYPIHNLKVYLAKEAIDDITGEPISKKFKYSLKGENGIGESTLCWKADYMSTDHANTFNANFANDLFTDKLPSQVADPKVQNTVYGIRCLLFQRDDENSSPVFIADGCLNNDKGNNNAFGLVDKSYDEAEISEGVTRPLNDTTRQKWEFTNNSSALDFFQADGLLAISNDEYYAKTAFESTYPDEGDLEDEGLEPNYNHLQVLMTWVHQRANYWDADDTPTGTVTYNESTGEYTTTGTVYTYNNIPYSNVRDYKKAIFKNEFTRHFNLNHALTYHLFSEFIALCDNRAKNMFIRCDDVRNEVIKDTSNNIIFSGNNNPNATFFTNTTNIGTQEDPIYALSNANQINWEESTFAIWYPVLYDLDSCYGVENVGRITIPYDADWNYSYNDKKQFSGVESRLWLMVEDAFASELKTLAQTLYPNSLNYNTFYNTQIQAMLDSVCPAVINQDMLLKFDAYWADGFIDYSLPNNPHVYRDYKYIQRGSRAYQKDTFIKLRSNYLSSKYTTSNFMNDQIRFRSSVIIPVSNSGITLTTNQTLYPAITYGDNKAAIRSTNKIGPGESVTLYASDQVGNTDTIHIGGASALTDIGDISKFEPYNLDVSGGINLKSLVVGSNVVNASTNKIDGLGSCTLLETINVRNCTGFSGTLNLSGNGLIKNVYTSGSNITNIELYEGCGLTNIEYSATTQIIKLINHKDLSSFTYENSSNNNYSALTKLHVENCNKAVYDSSGNITGYTCAIPIVDIVNKTISHLTQGIRIVGLIANLGDDSLFLENITSDLAKNKYINNSGAYVANSANPPFISGTVTITTIRQSLYNKLREMYPNLIINYTTIETESTIEYYNYDGTTLLYTDYRTGRENYIDPVADTNPITGQPYISMPTKPDDEQYKYTFGLYDGNGDYIKLSGWVKQGTTTSPSTSDLVQGNTIFIAYYPTTILQQYTVSWYEDENATTPLLSYQNQNYGVDISTYQAPEERNAITRAKIVGNTVKVFKGWNRPVGKLTGNVNIYAQWETSTIDNTTQSINMSTLNAADIYAIATLGDEAKRRLLEDKLGNSPIFVKMGQDFNYTAGVNTYDLLGGASKFTFNSAQNSQDGYISSNSIPEVKIYDGNSGRAEIRPLQITSDWTLAIDYKFLLNSTVYGYYPEFVLASCYQNANSSISGFKVSLVKNNSNTGVQQFVRVSWGTATATIDYVTIDSSADAKQYVHSYRNMLVLRHRASDPSKLTIYYAAPNVSNIYNMTETSVDYGSDYDISVTSTDLTWNNMNNIDTPLILGGNYVGSTTNIEADRTTRGPAKGIIYWAKYWDGDLGNKNCLALASWPHETIPFLLSGYNNNSIPTRQIIENTNLSFIAAQAIGDRYSYIQNGDIGTTPNWSTSRARTLCNNRLYKGMSIPYQSIIKQTSIASSTIDTENTNNIYPTRSNDYLYLPTEREVSATTPSHGVKTNEIWSDWNSPWPWMKTSNITNLYKYQNGELVIATASSIAPFLYRFSNGYIKSTARIFDMTTDPYNNGGTWTYNNEQISVQSGDIWINGNIAYMYFTNAEISEGLYVDIVTTGGGWKKAGIWQLRTYNVNAGYSSENQFEKIDAMGHLVTQPGTTYERATGRLLCPEFSI